MGYAGILQRAGWTEASEGQDVSLVLIQTCTVTMSADAQGRQMVRKLKKQHPAAKILLTGCYAQRAEAELVAMPEVDYVIGNLNPEKNFLFSQIANTKQKEDTDFPLPGEFSRTRPFIKIQDGCDARCSYCIIPAIRGKSRSLPVGEVVRRVELLRDRGYKEMILTGISMGGYVKDLHPKSSLSALLSQLRSLPGNFKIRLSSVEPEEIDDAFVDVFSSTDRFQPHVHLPLQSASDRVLKRMRRQYLFHRYDRIVSSLLGANPKLSLGTDILVGFPDEDAGAFQETYRYVEQTPFSYCHVFPFSPRPDTSAASFPASAGNGEITERATKLRDLSKIKSLNYRSQFVGEKLPALLLRGTNEALTTNYIRVDVNETVHKSEFVSIRIHSVDGDGTRGTIIQ
jgi:threonylcarbamoyladenosine tRNA methylthiotransferase MtaB